MWLRFWGCLAVGLLGLSTSTAWAADDRVGRLEFVEAPARDELDSVNTSVISPDGKFLYASAWKRAALSVFARDPRTGRLESKQTITDPENLAGATGLTVSGDGDFAVAAAFQSKTAVLYLRDRERGLLGRMDIARDGENGVRLGFPVVAAFAPDSQGVVILDDAGPDLDGQGAVASFRVVDGKLVPAGVDGGREGCYAGLRGAAFHPDGKTLFLAAQRAGTLVVADRDPATGRTSVRQVIKDEDGDLVHGLAGAMGVAVSRDGRFVYVCSGRFQGDDAVSVFRFDDDGRLTFIQEIINGRGELKDFEGGNHLAISPDGLNLYAAATRSGKIACFRRDPASGKLALLETIADGARGGPLGVDAVAVSPDGRYVYAPTEDKRSIAIFRRLSGRASP
jgi:6-phosphogluconolactonase (cycloisomerase 2 family)